jgi:hypothetical protein
MSEKDVDPIVHFTTINYSGKALIQEHGLDHDGVWQIIGADMSDYGSSCTNAPRLAVVSGRLRHVIDYAYTLDRWYGYGGGGTIELLNVVQLNSDSIARIKMNQKRLEEVKVRMRELESEAAKLRGEFGGQLDD